MGNYCIRISDHLNIFRNGINILMTPNIKVQCNFRSVTNSYCDAESTDSIDTKPFCLPGSEPFKRKQLDFEFTALICKGGGRERKKVDPERGR